MRNTHSLLRCAAALLAISFTVFAGEVESVRPECATEGDHVVLIGSEFAEEPVVTFGDAEADVVRSNETHVLVRVPEGVGTGTVTVRVDGATIDMEILAVGSPIVLHLSSQKAVAGQTLFLIGRRLHGGTAEFVNGDDEVAAGVDLRGGFHAAFLKVPDDLALGEYTLRVTLDESDSGACSAEIEIVEAGEASLHAIEPEDQLPGGFVLLTGTNLGSLGHVRVIWTNGDDTLKAFGFSNGFDRVYSRVPHTAEAGETYEVSVAVGDDADSGSVEYEVGTPAAPEITELEFDEGPAGSPLTIRGKGLVGGFHAKPLVEFTKDDESTEAHVIYAAPGFGSHDDEILIRIPDVEDGVYTVTVSNGDQKSDGVEFEVKDLPLAVTSMDPDHQGPRGPKGPVVIEGAGFGSGAFGGAAPASGGGKGHGGFGEIDIIWKRDGADDRKGFVLFHTDRSIVVIPPGAWFDPLDDGDYTVEVVINPGEDDEESVEAGSYTVG